MVGKRFFHIFLDFLMTQVIKYSKIYLYIKQEEENEKSFGFICSFNGFIHHVFMR